MVDDDDGDDVPLFVPSTGTKGAPPAKCSGVAFRTTAYRSDMSCISRDSI